MIRILQPEKKKKKKERKGNRTCGRIHHVDIVEETVNVAGRRPRIVVRISKVLVHKHGNLVRRYRPGPSAPASGGGLEMKRESHYIVVIFCTLLGRS